MKYLMIFAALFLASCSEKSPEKPLNRPTAEREGLPYGVSKFKDGDVTCYLYYSDGISCMKESK